ncbi:MAG TPA: peptide-methionine (S)-S-oxide reductase MsrA [Stellaceae bacterium]|nr:peptide-methionine (S)-S-oxide reductase MsrA [Stellaceae bacterium]
MTHSCAARLSRPTVVAALLGVLGMTLWLGTGAAADGARAVPAPAVDEPAPAAAAEVAVLAGGCFWGVQGVFQHVAGVTSAVSGYAGGAKDTADYHAVSTGSTGHAESVQITFDPHKVSYGRILQIYFSVVHDPTELNRQGPDVGTQYRSAIFPQSAEQARIAEAYIAQLDAAHVFPAPIVTKIEPGKTFYAAEDYHQNYLTLHPTQPYIAINDLPKIRALKERFPGVYREAPVLVAAK